MSIQPVCITNNEKMNVYTYRSGAFVFFDIYIKQDINVTAWNESIYDMYAGRPIREFFVNNNVNPKYNTRLKLKPDGEIVCSGTTVPSGGVYQGCYISEI